MATITPPYADPGRAAFQELDTYVQNYLIAGSHPELKPAYSFDLPNNVDYKQFLVVGLSVDKKLVPATKGQSAAAASGTLTFSGTGTAADTITIAGRVYTLVAALTAANQVLIGADAAGSAANFAAAVNGGAGAGVAYHADTLPHASASASVVGAVVTVTAKVVGDDGNEIATTESGTGTAFGAATLTGGRDSGGIKAIGVLAHAAALGGSGTAKGQVLYSGCFNQDALVWDASFATDADKQNAFWGSPSPTTIIVAKRA